MLQKLSEQVRACHERAAEARRRAEAAKDRALKNSFLEIETHWLVLARNYALAERADHASLQLKEINTLLIQDGNLDPLYARVLDAAIGLMSADVGSMSVRSRLRELASVRRRFGYRRLHILLTREGIVMTLLAAMSILPRRRSSSRTSLKSRQIASTGRRRRFSTNAAAE